MRYVYHPRHGGARGFVRREALIWLRVLRLVLGKRKAPGFAYGRSLRGTFIAVLVMLVVEGLVVEFVLALVLGNSVWVWIGLALHLYAVGWIVGVIAAVRQYPHVLDGAVLRLRDSVFAELVVPVGSIASVRVAKRANLGRSGLQVEGGVALLAYGDATVHIELKGGAELGGIALTVDDPAEFLRALTP